jgi:hypothetical protein
MRWFETITAAVIAVGLACSSAPGNQPPETIEQKQHVTRYRGPEIEIEVDSWWAQRSLGDELLLLEVAFSAGREGSPLVRLESIRAVTPEGHAIPPLDRAEFRRVYGSLRMAITQTDAWAGPSGRFMMSRQPCGRWFVAPPESLALQPSEIRTSRSQVCFGPLVFHVPGGIQPGPWALTIDLEETRAKVPFTLEQPGPR